MTVKILQNEMVAALKARNKIRKDTISALIAAVKKAGIDKGCRDDIPESLVDEVLLKEQKTMQEMIDTCPEDRAVTLELYRRKMEVISEFAPKLISDPFEIEKMVTNLCWKEKVALTKENKGKVMKLVMPQLKGKVDMKVANTVMAILLK